MAKPYWMQNLKLKKGALRKTAKVKAGKKIGAKKLAVLAKKPGITGKRARLAQVFARARKG